MTGKTQYYVCLGLLFSAMHLQAGDSLPLRWNFNHTQDSFAMFIEDDAVHASTTGLTNLGVGISHPSGHFKLYADALWVNRDEPFARRIGDFNGISNIGGEKALRLYHVVLGVGSADSTWSASLGLQILDDEFLIVEEAALLLNSGFGMASVITGNTLVPTYPVSSLGAHLRFRAPDKRYFAALGVYDGNSGGQKANPHGTRIGIHRDEGILLIAEAGWQGARASTGKTQFKAGIWHHTGRFSDFDTGQRRRGKSAIYGIVNKRASLAGRQLGFFARFAHLLAEKKNLLLHSFEAGVNWYAPIKHRPDDQLSLGLIWSHFGHAAVRSQETTSLTPVHRDESIVELAYKISVNKHLSLQPDLQWINNPHNGRTNAFLAGLRVIVQF